MKEMTSRVPADSPVDVKNVKTLDTHDGYALTASLYYEGKRVAYVENGGTGGPNMYSADPKNPGARDGLSAAHRYADRWQGEDEQDRSENLDLLVEALMEEKDLAREARKAAKQGAEFAAVAYGSPYWFDGAAHGEDEEPDAFAEVFIVTAPSREQFLRQAEERGRYYGYRVLHEAVTA